jgi:arginase
LKSIRIIRIDSELGAGTRGSSKGSAALEAAAEKKGDDFFKRYPIVQLADENERLNNQTDTPYAIRIEGIAKIYDRLCEEVKDTMLAGSHFPVIIAGDHSSSGGSIAGVKAAYPNQRMGIIWVDAHGDLHSPYTTPSGNVHGMPLTAVLNTDNVEKQINQPSKKAIAVWDELKKTGGMAPKAKMEDVVFFGVRDLEQAEAFLMEKGGMRNFTVSELREKGIQACVAEAMDRLAACDMLYLSFDVDSMDCEAVSMGTGTPVKDGLFPEEAKEILKRIVDSGKVACFDIVEINPLLDNKGNTMAETAFDILKATVEALEHKL